MSGTILFSKLLKTEGQITYHYFITCGDGTSTGAAAHQHAIVKFDAAGPSVVLHSYINANQAGGTAITSAAGMLFEDANYWYPWCAKGCDFQIRRIDKTTLLIDTAFLNVWNQPPGGNTTSIVFPLVYRNPAIKTTLNLGLRQAGNIAFYASTVDLVAFTIGGAAYTSVVWDDVFTGITPKTTNAGDMALWRPAYELSYYIYTNAVLDAKSAPYRALDVITYDRANDLFARYERDIQTGTKGTTSNVAYNLIVERTPNIMHFCSYSAAVENALVMCSPNDPKDPRQLNIGRDVIGEASVDFLENAPVVWAKKFATLNSGGDWKTYLAHEYADGLVQMTGYDFDLDSFQSRPTIDFNLHIWAQESSGNIDYPYGTCIGNKWNYTTLFEDSDYTYGIHYLDNATAITHTVFKVPKPARKISPIVGVAISDSTAEGNFDVELFDQYDAPAGADCTITYDGVDYPGYSLRGNFDFRFLNFASMPYSYELMEKVGVVGTTDTTIEATFNIDGPCVIEEKTILTGTSQGELNLLNKDGATTNSGFVIAQGRYAYMRPYNVAAYTTKAKVKKYKV